jgi:hypothetical protein
LKSSAGGKWILLQYFFLLSHWRWDLENQPFVVLGKTNTQIGRLGFLLTAAWDPTLFVGARPSCCSIHFFGFLLLRQ